MEVNQTVKNFFMKLGEDEELRGKLEAASKRQDLAECALLSREAGFDFSRADLEYMVNLAQAYQTGELSEEQLELVTGGGVTTIIMVTLIVGSIISLIAGTAACGATAGLFYGFIAKEVL
jgi:predicted ribosomally synthesized peptide with nif11-like leader